MGEVAQPAPHNMKQDEEADSFQRHSDALDDMKALDMKYKLPVTGDRTAGCQLAVIDHKRSAGLRKQAYRTCSLVKRTSSAYHCVTSLVGAGVLGLPAATASLGWAAASILTFFFWITSLYTLWQMASMHHIGTKRLDRYHELGQYAFGAKRGLWITLPPQLIVMFGLDAVYMITAGKSMHGVWNLACQPPCSNFGLSAWIAVFVGLQLILSQIPNFNGLRGISFLAALMSLSYCTIAIVGAIVIGKQPNAYYNLDRFTTSEKVFNSFNALGTFAFAYAAHNVVLEIQASLPAPPNTTKRMMAGTYVAYVVVAWCYWGVGLSGYYAFGNNVGDDVLVTPAFKGRVPTGLLIAANMMVVVHVMGSFQVYAMPVFDMMETLLVKNGFSNALPYRLLVRSAYVIAVGFFAITLPFFGSLLGFLGALAFGPTTFWLPPLMFLAVRKPGISSWHFWASWFCIVTGVAVTILGCIGGMRGIIHDASTYRFYQ